MATILTRKKRTGYRLSFLGEEEEKKAKAEERKDSGETQCSVKKVFTLVGKTREVISGENDDSISLPAEESSAKLCLPVMDAFSMLMENQRQRKADNDRAIRLREAAKKRKAAPKRNAIVNASDNNKRPSIRGRGRGRGTGFGQVELSSTIITSQIGMGRGGVSPCGIPYKGVGPRQAFALTRCRPIDFLVRKPDQPRWSARLCQNVAPDPHYGTLEWRDQITGNRIRSKWPMLLQESPCCFLISSPQVKPYTFGDNFEYEVGENQEAGWWHPHMFITWDPCEKHKGEAARWDKTGLTEILKLKNMESMVKLSAITHNLQALLELCGLVFTVKGEKKRGSPSLLIEMAQEDPLTLVCGQPRKSSYLGDFLVNHKIRARDLGLLEALIKPTRMKPILRETLRIFWEIQDKATKRGHMFLKTEDCDLSFFKLRELKPILHCIVPTRFGVFTSRNWKYEEGTAILMKYFCEVVVEERQTIHCLDADSLDFSIGEGRILDPQQQEAVKNAFTYPITATQGPGGSGKSSTLIKIKELVEKMPGNNKQAILAASVTRSFTTKLRLLYGVKSATVAMLCSKVRDVGNLPIELTCKALDKEYGGAKILFIDECSMISGKQMFGLMLFACFCTSIERIIFLGDDQQLPSCTAGNVLQEISLCGEKIIPRVVLRTNHRSDGRELFTAARLIADGKGNLVEWHNGRSLIRMWPRPSTHLTPETKKLFEGLIYDRILSRLDLEDFKNFQAIAFRHIEVTLLNDIFRDWFLRNKYLGAYTDDKRARFWVGERIQPKINEDSIPLNNGQQYTIAGYFDVEYSKGVKDKYKLEDIASMIDPEIKHFTDGRVPPKKVRMIVLSVLAREDELIWFCWENMPFTRASFLYSYATTIHSAQGSEYEKVLYYIAGSPNENREHIYTAITRAKKLVYLLGTLENCISVSMKKPERRRSALSKLVELKFNNAASIISALHIYDSDDKEKAEEEEEGEEGEEEEDEELRKGSEGELPSTSCLPATRDYSLPIKINQQLTNLRSAVENVCFDSPYIT